MEENIKTNNSKHSIMEAAAKVFAEKGNAGARMKAIAKESKVSSALLHYHYKSKDMLYFEVLKYYIANQIEELEMENYEFNDNFINSKENFTKKNLEKIIKNYDNFFRNNKYFTKLLVQEMSSDSKTLKKVFNQIKKENKLCNEEKEKWIEQQFKKSIENKIIRDIDPFHTTITIMTLVISQYTYNSFVDILLENNNINKNKFKKERINHIIDQIWNIIKY